MLVLKIHDSCLHTLRIHFLGLRMVRLMLIGMTVQLHFSDISLLLSMHGHSAERSLCLHWCSNSLLHGVFWDQGFILWKLAFSSNR